MKVLEPVTFCYKLYHLFLCASGNLPVHGGVGSMLGSSLDIDWPVCGPIDQALSGPQPTLALVGQESSSVPRGLAHGH